MLIERDGLAIPIKLEFVEIKCRRRKPRVSDFDIAWPTLSMKSWVQYLWSNHPRFLLGGYEVDQPWETMFSEFWDTWRQMEPQHHIYTSGKPLSHCVPYYTHGDEGQTLRKCAFMVESWQPAISWKGINHTTLSGLLVHNF